MICFALIVENITNMCNSISCTSMRPRNLGNAISVIMRMPFKKDFKNMLEIVTRKKVISKFVTYADIKPPLITI
jgi:hypothetical protein